MKKLICTALCLIMIIMCLPACSRAMFYTEGTGELTIVATVFPPFDLAREVTGGRAEVTLLQANGGDLHDYTPTAATLDVLSKADIFICVGGVTDSSWVDDAVSASENSDLTVIKLTELCDGTLSELEGHNHGSYCEENHGHDHGHDHEHTADDGHGHTADEHVWLSLRNAVKIVEEIRRVCAEKDAENADFYRTNSESYVSSLSALDTRYAEAVNASEKKTAVFADRFPFIYLTADYGICHYAAFGGCSSETDASFATAVRLTEAVNENSLSYVFVTENTDAKIAESIASATGCGILTLNSLQSVTAAQIQNGATYLGIMEENLVQLQKAL